MLIWRSLIKLINLYNDVWHLIQEKKKMEKSNKTPKKMSLTVLQEKNTNQNSKTGFITV